MKRFAFVLPSCTVVLLAMHALWAQNKAVGGEGAAGFEKLKALAGEWQSQGPHGSTTISYQVVAGGSAVMETLFPPNEPSMLTLYHLDASQLMMTHYCSAGNQPRMRATPALAGEVKNLSFTLVDATNLSNPLAGHMQNVTFTFQDQDHFTQVWTWQQDGKEALSIFNLVRKK